MPNHNSKIIYLFITGLISGLHIFAQNTCPPNIDLEYGDFSNWVCKAGNVSVINSQNTVNLSISGPLTNIHTIIPYSDTTKDYYGGFPVRCPNGSDYSVKLGNRNTGSQAEGIFYTYNIPGNANNFSILYQYAVVFENPGHAPEQQPRFRARVLNLTDGDTINCVSFDFTSSGNLPGFKTSPVNTEVLYKDWTPISLNLSGYAGKTIRLEFITSDCTLGGHFGYAYVDVNSECDGSVVGSTVCIGDTTVDLIAPYGFESYTWYADNTFTQILGTGQVLTLSPAPNTGSIYPVIVNPYPGFGCMDTVYAIIKTEPKPLSFAGSDNTVCRYELSPLGTVPDSANKYLWSPANLVTDFRIANPDGFVNTFSPQQFIVKTTNRASGCFSFDSVVITPIIIDTSLLVTGKIDYCSNQVYNNSLTVSNLSSGIQWLLNNMPIAGANNRIYIPTTAGTYRAIFTQNGCTDTTRIVNFIDHVSPYANYTVNQDSQCITNNSFIFTNTSTINNTDSITYLWKFGDGSISQNINPVKLYTTSGRFNLKLIATSNFNCSDSISGFIEVIPNAVPGFLWDAACNNNPIQFSNKTDEKGSLSVNYLWDFNNGSGSVLKQPLPFTYTNTAVYNVSLRATALGCETAPQTITKPVTVYEPVPGIRYRDITVPANYSSQLVTRWGVGNIYNWQPTIQLTNPFIRTPYFKAINDVKYLIAITDKHNCITTDTLQLFVLNKKGWYMPNAFTPNGDGLNDIIRPYLEGMNGLKRFAVYNRVGNMIFNTTRDGEGWNGTYKGAILESGNFIWVIEYTDMYNNHITQKGTLMLIK